MKSAIHLFRSHFAGFLGDVHITRPEHARLADFPTTKGVLIKPDLQESRYRVAWPLVDELVRGTIIPQKVSECSYSHSS
jgi:hypothetical protein